METKEKVPICAIEPGMILANDILSEEGKVLLARDLPLTYEHIANLQQWGVQFVEIVSGVCEEADKGLVIEGEREFIEFYEDTIDTIKQAFETTYLTKSVSVNRINKLVKDRIQPLIDAHRAIGFLYKIRVYCDYTYRHSINVAIISGIIGRSIGMKPDNIRNVVMAGLLHDIGKLFIKKEILSKPGKLTKQEMATIQEHANLGYQMLMNYPHLCEDIKLGVMQHHERFDGSGYPLGLKQDEISLYGRVIAVADIYDAMTTDRVYRRKVSPFCAADTIAKQMYRQLDPEVCLAFFRSIHASLAKSRVVLSNGIKGEVIYLHHVYPQRPAIILSDGSCLDLNEHTDIEIIDIAQ